MYLNYLNTLNFNTGVQRIFYSLLYTVFVFSVCYALKLQTEIIILISLGVFIGIYTLSNTFLYEISLVSSVLITIGVIFSIIFDEFLLAYLFSALFTYFITWSAGKNIYKRNAQ